MFTLKYQHSRISTPSFIRKHTLRSLTTPLRPQNYFLRKNIQYDQNPRTGLSTKCILLEKGYNLKSTNPVISNCYEIVGSCNGIICLFNKGVQSITLFNPSIRRKLTVPAIHSSNYRESLGFGFDPISDDYKIVAMSHFSYGAAESSFIYSLKANSWSKIVSATPNVVYLHFGQSACFFNGTLHWVGELNDINQHCIITFHLSTNVFGFISLPKPGLLYYNPMIIRGCLAMMFFDCNRGDHCSIWVMREYNNVASWTKAFDILEGRLMNEGHKDSISYDHESGTRLRLIVDSFYSIDIDMCVESLELLDKEIVRDESYFLLLDGLI